MRNLLFMRHAKSDWGEPLLADHDRSLNERGARVAPQMGLYLAQRQLVPDVVFASTARRVQQTLELMLEHWNTQPGLYSSRELYLATADRFYRAVSEATAEHRTVMVLGHNPGMAQLAAEYVSGAPHFPTAAVLHLQAHLDDWHRIGMSYQNSQFVELLKPKELGFQ